MSCYAAAHKPACGRATGTQTRTRVRQCVRREQVAHATKSPRESGAPGPGASRRPASTRATPDTPSLPRPCPPSRAPAATQGWGEGLLDGLLAALRHPQCARWGPGRHRRCHMRPAHAGGLDRPARHARDMPQARAKKPCSECPGLHAPLRPVAMRPRCQLYMVLQHCSWRQLLVPAARSPLPHSQHAPRQQPDWGLPTCIQHPRMRALWQTPAPAQQFRQEAAAGCAGRQPHCPRLKVRRCSAVAARRRCRGRSGCRARGRVRRAAACA